MTLNQQEENKDETIKTAESELSRMQDALHTAKVSLWGALLTIDSIFLAIFSAFFNKSLLTRFEIVFFDIAIVLPIISTLLMFLINKYHKKESLEVSFLVYRYMLKKIRNEPAEKEGKASLDRNSKLARRIAIFNRLNNVLETIAICSTLVSVLLICVWIIFVDC